MNVALIGCSGMGRMHAQMAVNCGLKLLYCADLSRKAATELAQLHHARATTDIDTAINDPDVDIVAIATPTTTHADLVLKAAKAGKHIFCEKPFCRTAKEAKATLKKIEKCPGKLFVGHVVRYFQEFDAMREQIKNGAIGKPGFVKLYRGGIFPGGANSWFADYELSGGVTFDCMIHDLDWIRYTFGEAERIYCQALLRSEPEKLDYSQVTMRMKNGVIATVIGTWAHPAGFSVKAEICGDKGMLTYNSAEAPLSAMHRDTGGGPSMIVPSQPVDISPYQLEWEDFIRWIECGKKPRVSAEDAVRAVEMAEAALKSAKTKQPVKL